MAVLFVAPSLGAPGPIRAPRRPISSHSSRTRRRTRGQRGTILPSSIVNDPRGHRSRLGTIVRDDDRRRVGRDQDVTHLAREARPQFRVERAKRFVEQQEARPRRERPRERDALAFAARQLVDGRDRDRRRAGPFEHLGDPRARSSLGARAISSPNATFPRPCGAGRAWPSWNTRPNPRRWIGTCGHVLAVQRHRARCTARCPRSRRAASTCRTPTARAARPSRPARPRETSRTAGPAAGRDTPPRRRVSSSPLIVSASLRCAQPFGRHHDRPCDRREQHRRGERHADVVGVPGRPSRRKIAVGRVGRSGRARKPVAPNSPSETANAKPTATPKGRGRAASRQRPHLARGGAERRGGFAGGRRWPRSAGHEAAGDKGKRDERLADGHEPERRGARSMPHDEALRG